MRGLFRTFASAKHISINRKLKIKTTMNKTLCRALLLCLLTLPCTSAVADSDVTAEKNKQNKIGFVSPERRYEAPTVARPPQM